MQKGYGSAVELARQVDTAIEKILETFEANDYSEETKQIILSLIEETRVSLEELSVSDEEIRQQNEALEASRFTLENERHYYCNLFEAAPVGYIVTDSNGIIKEANRSAQELLNLAESKLVGKPIIVFVPLEQRIDFRSYLLNITLSKTVRTYETVFQPRASAQTRSVAVTIAPMNEVNETDGAGNITWLLHDITDQKIAEAAKLDHFFRETFEQAAVGIAHLDGTGRWLRVNQKLCRMLGYSREELLALMPEEITHADDKGIIQDVLPHLVTGKLDHVSLEQRYISSRGEVISVHLTISNVYDEAGHYIYSIAVMNDITGSKRLLAAEHEQRTLSEALRETALTLTSTLDFDEVLDRILTIVSRIFSQEAASVLLKEADRFHIARGWGYDEQLTPELEAGFKDLNVPSQKMNIFEYIENTKEAVVLSDCIGHDPSETDKKLDGVCSLICVPIISQDDVIGCLELHSSIPGFFTNYQVEPLQAFAAQAAIAIQNARVHQQAQVLAAHEERQRLARDLHDAVTQTLFTASLISESLVRHFKKSPNQTLSRLEELHMLTRGALAEMRNLLMELRPDYLLKTNLSIQLHQLANAMKSRKKIVTVVEATNVTLLSPEVHVAFYRIAQEALNNVIKHSHANKVEIHLACQSGRVCLHIRDNGRGFNQETDFSGVGMNTMRERAESIHALLQISSTIDTGTQISVCWPQEE